MTIERIEDFREILLPFVKKMLLEINYENLGESDAEEFAKDFDEILNLAIKALEQEPKTGHWKAFIHDAYHGTDEDGEPIWREVTVYHCSQCNRRTLIKEKYCPNCGAKMESEDRK